MEGRRISTSSSKHNGYSSQTASLMCFFFLLLCPRSFCVASSRLWPSKERNKMESKSRRRRRRRWRRWSRSWRVHSSWLFFSFLFFSPRPVHSGMTLLLRIFYYSWKKKKTPRRERRRSTHTDTNNRADAEHRFLINFITRGSLIIISGVNNGAEYLFPIF